MLFILLLVLAILGPRLPLIGQKIMIGVAAPLIMFGLFYMIIVPGWVPGRSGRARLAWRVVLFIAIAAVIVTGATSFILR